jgi:hypothetical protein
MRNDASEINSHRNTPYQSISLHPDVSFSPSRLSKLQCEATLQIKSRTVLIGLMLRRSLERGDEFEIVTQAKPAMLNAILNQKAWR